MRHSHTTDQIRCLLCTNVREWLIALSAGAVLFVGMWALFIDTNNARVTESELRNLYGAKAEVFAPGEVMLVYRMACVSKVVPGTVVVEIVNLKNGAVYPIGSRATGAMQGCNPRTISQELPDDIPGGVYEYRSTATYHVNPLRTVVFVLPSLQFTVQSPKKEQQ